MQTHLDKAAANASMDYEEPKEFPEQIPNSTAQFDGDFNAYLYAWLDQSLAQNLEALKTDLERKRKQAGCEILNVHTTHGSKASRENFALVRQYQETRKGSRDPEKDARVAQIRDFMQTYETDKIKPFPQFEVEADDSMSIMQSVERSLGNYSVIITKDKDLNMVAGWHMDLDTLEVIEIPNGYGHLHLEENKTVANNAKGYTIKKKATGIGTSFFWLQMLMGDGADSIPGCPGITADLLNKYFPTKAVAKALDDIAANKNVATAYKTLQKRNSGNLGGVRAYELLKLCTTDKQAFKVVSEVYHGWYGKQPFTFEDWQGNKHELTAGHMIIEQARLLWMLRTWEDDAILFFHEVAKRNA